MRRVLFAIVFALAALPASAQVVLEPDPGIEATIRSQFDAFAARDVEGAWQFASPNIQRIFRTPENFGRMVQQGYPMVWDPSDVRFLDLQAFAGLIVQRVEVTDRSGRIHVLGYAMVRTGEGWQINGVQILPAPDVGA